jgi:hypothetical protein
VSDTPTPTGIDWSVGYTNCQQVSIEVSDTPTANRYRLKCQIHQQVSIEVLDTPTGIDWSVGYTNRYRLIPLMEPLHFLRRQVTRSM